MSELLQMIPMPSRRANDSARDDIIDRYIDEINRVARGSSQDLKGERVDRLVPQLFAAKITSSALQTPVLGRAWWEYDWIEVERSASGGSWTTVNYGRSSTRQGKAWNAYELSIDNDGGNIGPAGVSRLEYPIDAIVPMYIDPAGRAWFNEVNPIEISCDGGGVGLLNPTIYSGDAPPGAGLGIDGDLYFEY